MLLTALAFAETPTPATEEDGRRADTEMRAHLWRVNALGGASLVAGGAMMAAGWEDDRLRWAGIATVGSGVIDLAIGVPPLLAAPRPSTPQEIAQSREIIALNVGLDVAYIGTGLLMGFLAPDERVQGAGLTILDVVVWARLPPPVRK